MAFNAPNDCPDCLVAFSPLVAVSWAIEEVLTGIPAKTLLIRYRSNLHRSQPRSVGRGSCTIAHAATMGDRLAFLGLIRLCVVGQGSRFKKVVYGYAGLRPGASRHSEKRVVIPRSSEHLDCSASPILRHLF